MDKQETPCPILCIRPKIATKVKRQIAMLSSPLLLFLPRTLTAAAASDFPCPPLPADSYPSATLQLRVGSARPTPPRAVCSRGALPFRGRWRGSRHGPAAGGTACTFASPAWMLRMDFARGQVPMRPGSGLVSILAVRWPSCSSSAAYAEHPYPCRRPRQANGAQRVSFLARTPDRLLTLPCQGAWIRGAQGLQFERVVQARRARCRACTSSCVHLHS
jgi:hypothetical protein